MRSILPCTTYQSTFAFGGRVGPKPSHHIQPEERKHYLHTPAGRHSCSSTATMSYKSNTAGHNNPGWDFSPLKTQMNRLYSRRLP